MGQNTSTPIPQSNKKVLLNSESGAYPAKREKCDNFSNETKESTAVVDRQQGKDLGLGKKKELRNPIQKSKETETSTKEKRNKVDENTFASENSNAKMTQKLDENRLVVAIDFGTTYSGYSFAFEKDFKRDPLGSIITNEWRFSTGVTSVTKAPTTVLFSPNGEFHSFGYDAESKYAELVENEDEDHATWYYFRRFKMTLHDNMQLNRGFDLEDESGHKMPAKKVFAASIRYLKQDLENLLEERNPGFEPSLWVITVPAIWDEPAKQFMREAANEAGIQNNLILALEPESAAIYCKTLPDGSLHGSKDQEVIDCFKPGGMYMVLDLGGGTVDTAVHEVREDGSLKEIYKACGGAWGGTKVEEEFLQHIRNLFGDEVIPELQGKCPSEWLSMTKQFEERKKQVMYSKKRDVKLQIPPKLVVISTRNVEDLTQYKTNLMISDDSFKRFFRSSSEKIEEHIRNILETFPNLKMVFMVGGFSESGYIQEFIRKKFPGKRIIVPLNAGMSVLKGAIIIGFNELIKIENQEGVQQIKAPYISERVSKWTYGVRTVVQFIEGNHKPEHGVYINGIKYCRNIFRVLVKEGETISIHEERCCEMGSSHEQEHRRYIDLKLPFFASKSQIPTYTTEKGCELVGEIIIKCPDAGWPKYVRFKVAMYFGQSEFSVKVHDMTNEGIEAYSYSYDFLS